MTDTPTDKKLSERFVEALEGGFLADFVYDNERELITTLRLAESHPSAIREAVEGESHCTICDDIVMIDDSRQAGDGTPGGFEHMGDVWKQISEWAAAIRARGEEKGNG